MTRRIRNLLPIVWLMALLLLPATAYLLGGRQPLLENRGKTPIPALGGDALRQDATYRQMDAAIRERLPLRGDAIDMRGRIATRVFGDSVNGDVILGGDDWLYYRPELLICEPNGRPEVPPEDAVEVLTRTIGASGRRPVVIVVGSKIVTHRAHLKGVSDADLACLETAESRVQERLVETPGAYSIQPELDALEAAGRPTFLRSDTHWNALGRKVFLRAVLDGIRPGLAAEARLRAIGEFDRPGDLGPFLGQRRVDRDRRLTVTGDLSTRFDPGEMLIIGDSQLWNAVQVPGADGKTILERILPDQALCTQYEMKEHGCADLMLAAETVVLESVARNFQLVVNSCWQPVATLAATVRGRPARWSDGDPARRPLAGSPSARVDYEERRTDLPRLLRIPVRGLPVGPVDDPDDAPAVTVDPGGAPRPCELTTVTDGRFGIVIPVAPGERVADLDLSISGPSGTELGRPEVLLLDGRPLPRSAAPGPTVPGGKG